MLDVRAVGPRREDVVRGINGPDVAAPEVWAARRAEGIRRARFRESYGEPRLVEAGAVEEYEIDLVATSNVFLEGHAIRVSVTSSSFPRFDRNTNTGNELGVDGPDALRSARQAVFHDAGRPSFVELPVVPR